MKNDQFQRRLAKMVKIASKHAPVAGHRVYCEIWNGERIVFGNNRKTHFCDEHYMKNVDAVGMHAEVAALMAAESKPYHVKGAIALVARAKKTRRGGEFVAGLARPCEGCMRALKDWGISFVMWTKDQRLGHPVTYGGLKL